MSIVTEPQLYHVTTPESADQILEDGYDMRDWTHVYEEWNLSLDFDTGAWAVPESAHHSLMGVALAEHLLETERLDNHPSRTCAGYFYANPWTAREKMNRGSFGDVCISVDPAQLDGPIAVGSMRHVGRIFSLLMDAAEYERKPLQSVDTLRDWASEYWLHVQPWEDQQHPHVEVFVPEETGVPAESVVERIDDPCHLADRGEAANLKRCE